MIMNKINKFFLLSAAALAGMSSFSACSSEDGDDNGNSGNNLGVVKTQFAINVPYAKGAGTRMSNNATQNNDNFLGIQSLRLFTYTGEPSAEVNIGKKISLGSDEAAYRSDNYRKIYRDIEIPEETSYFTLYGISKPYSTDLFENGAIEYKNAYTSSSNLSTSEISFNLKKINGTAKFSENENAKAIIAALQTVINTEFDPGTGDDPISWIDVANKPAGATSADVYAKNLFSRFTKLTAGSANSVKRALEGLKQQTNANTTDNTLLGAIAKNCQTALNTLTDNTFPNELNFPDGVAKLSFDSEKNTFSYVTSDKVALGSNTVDYTKMTYPSTITYFVSTPAMVSDKDLMELSDLPSYDKWTKDVDQAWANLTGFTQGKVKKSTRSIALREPLQYGVAGLKLSIKCADEKLKDNAKAQGYLEEDADITVPTDGYPVKAILVGGQPSCVGWNFEPNATDEKFDYTVYDKDMNGGISFKAQYNPEVTRYNYTLVLDNKNNAQTNQNDVFVTVELENTGAAFYGADGIIPAGGTFYLVAKLSLTNLGTTGEKPDDVDHIFVKDHTTEAKLTIGSLKNAYNCIPDLRSSLISLGLAVDLQWQKGVTFDYTIQ